MKTITNLLEIFLFEFIIFPLIGACDVATAFYLIPLTPIFFAYFVVITTFTKTKQLWK